MIKNHDWEPRSWNDGDQRQVTVFNGRVASVEYREGSWLAMVSEIVDEEGNDMPIVEENGFTNEEQAKHWADSYL